MTFTSHKSQISAPRVTNTWTKLGFFAENTYFFSNRFLFSTQAVLLDFWSNVDVISLRLRWLYYRSDWQDTKIKGRTLLIDWLKKLKKIKKETKEILPIYLSSRSSARCLLRWALRILLPNSYDFPERDSFYKIWIRRDYETLTLFKQAFSSCPLRKTEDENSELSKMEGFGVL